MARRLAIRLRAAWPVCLALVTLLGGCTRDQDYFDVMDEKEANVREITEILRSVKDAETMAQAKPKLELASEKDAETSRKANALPKPPPAKVKQRAEQQSFILQRTFDHLKVEAGRVSRLPGGEEFLKQFESTKGLLAAVQP